MRTGRRVFIHQPFPGQESPTPKEKMPAAAISSFGNTRLAFRNFNYCFQSDQSPIMIAQLKGHFGEHRSRAVNLVG
jgi:hypothetical protein